MTEAKNRHKLWSDLLLSWPRQWDTQLSRVCDLIAVKLMFLWNGNSTSVHQIYEMILNDFYDPLLWFLSKGSAVYYLFVCFTL